MINNIILHCVAFRCILPPGWGASPKRNHISDFSYNLIFWSAKESNQSLIRNWKLEDVGTGCGLSEVGVATLLIVGSGVQWFRGSWAQGLKGSRVRWWWYRFRLPTVDWKSDE